MTSYVSPVFGGALSVTVRSRPRERRRAVAVDDGGLEGEFLVVGGAAVDVQEAEGHNVGDDHVRHGAVDERVLQRVVDCLADAENGEARVRVDCLAELLNAALSMVSAGHRTASAAVSSSSGTSRLADDLGEEGRVRDQPVVLASVPETMCTLA